MESSLRGTRVCLAAALSFASLTFSGSALAAHGPADEVGHWMGFAHSGTAASASGAVVLDLAVSPNSGSFNLQGMISLPAVQMPLLVKGLITPFGFLYLSLSDANGNVVGFCDGSVMPVANFGAGSGQDDLGSLNFALRDAAGSSVTGHMNLLHMYG